MTHYSGPGPWGPGEGELSQAKFDGNNYDFATRIDALETHPPQPNDIVGITLTGSFLSMTQRDGTILGPVPFSPPMARWRNEWAATTAYVAFDFVTVTGSGLYGVLQDHTSALTFDANAVNLDDELLYRKVIGFSGSTANIDDLLDVVITSAADKDMLVYDTGSTHWVNKTTAQVTANLLGSTSGLLQANGSGVLSAATAGTNYAAAPSGSANTPLFNNGSGGFTNGTRSGNTTKVATVSGSLTIGNVLVSDASGNLVDGGSAGGGSPGGSSGDIQTNNGSGGFGAITPASGVATFLATPSSANLRAVLTDEVGTGVAYFVGGALGTPASATLTNATGLPLTGIASIANLRVLANVSGGSAAASANTMTAILDAVFGSTRGEILSRGASAWGGLSPGKAGYTLQLSSSLDPVWVQVATGGKGGTTGTSTSIWVLGADYATTTALAANTYGNGSSGVGATLTGNSNGALSVDGATPIVADRILVKDEAAGAHNGIYAVTTVGSGGAAYVLTRATDYDQAAEVVQGSAVAIAGGTDNAGTAWVLSTSSSITIGTTALDYDALTAVLPDCTAGQVLGNSNTFTAPAVPTSLSAIIDRAIASTRGAILYRGSGGWVALSPGTSGDVLTTAGAGGDPSWSTAGGGSGLGDVSGGSTSADGELAAYNGTGGKTLKQSFAKFSGPGTSVKTYTLPNASSTILTDNAAVTVAQGGTGQSAYTDGQLLIGNTATGGLSKATVTAGSNITVTNGNGTITIASTASASPAGSSGDIQTNDGAGGFSSITPASGIATFLATPSSANLRSALTDEVGTGAAYFIGGALGTPASATLSNAAGLPLTTGVTGTLPETNGGTGQATYTQGDLLYASASNTLAKLAKNTSASRYLSNTGTSNAPAWAQIDLTNGVTGILPIANGGTGLAAPPINLIFTIETVMANAEETHRFIPPACSFPSGAAGSSGTSGVAATGSATLTIKKNGSAFATFVWAGAGTAATVTISSTTSFNGSSDVLTHEGPATADATLAKIGINLAGSRS